MPLKYLACDFPLLETVCRRCGRHQVYATSKLVAHHGGYVSVRELKRIVADCPDRQATGCGDACRIHFPQIETRRGRTRSRTDAGTAAGLSLHREA